MFAEFGWPQWVVVVAMVVSSIHRMFEAGGYVSPRPSAAILGASVVTRPLILGFVLYSGGFFG